MKFKLTNLLSLALAGMLQLLPLLRSVLPTLQELASSPTGALILRFTAGGVALFGYHAVSSASSISISPGTATIGSPYAGTVTYSGSRASEVRSMSISNSCLGTHALAPGLTITYSGGSTANVSGTPTGSNAATFSFTLAVTDSSCGAGIGNSQTTGISYQLLNGGLTAPVITVAPQPAVAQIGSDVILSGAATGNPSPQYYWQNGVTAIPGATNNTFLIPAVKLTNAGVYTLVASNSQGKVIAACYFSAATSAGSNITAYHFTNYWVAGTPLTMTSFITNVPSASNTYLWRYNTVSVGVTTPNLILSSVQTVPSKSGTYTIDFNSTIGTGSNAITIVNNQSYDSYWVFGYLPVVTNQPSGLTVSPGANATFNVSVCGTSPSLYWYQNGTNLVATQNLTFNPTTATASSNASLTLTNVSAGNAGTYSVVVSNFWGTTTSSNAVLTVSSPLSVSAPQGQTNYAGKNVSLSATASGTGPFSYQWQQGVVNVTNGGATSGATSNVLSFTPATVSNSGNYQIIVTNLSGAVTSSVAPLSIVAVPNFALLLGTTNVTLSAAGGVVGSNYVVQFSTNIANTAGWVPLLTNVVPPGGSISFSDTNVNAGQRFYRVQFP